MDLRINELIHSISKKEPNYFGFYKEEIYTIQLELCDYNSTLIIPDKINVSAYCFIDKYFDLEEKIDWIKFEKSFRNEFNKYVHNTDMFKQILCDENNNVNLDKYIELTNKYNGIYELYQKVTDKNTIVCFLNRYKKISYNERLFGQHIISISSVGNHIAALTNEGHLYMMGSNTYGQLGNSDLIPISNFKLNTYFIQNNIRIRKVVCGFAHTGVITFENDLYMWGSGEHGRLGNNLTTDTSVPTKITVFNKNVKDLQLGSCNTCVLTNDGKVYTFGQNYYTGINTHNNILIPTLIPFDEEIESISIGGGGYHTMALTRNSKLYMWGQNRVGQLGFHKTHLPVNNENASYSPTPIHIKEVDSLNIVKINAFWANSVITCKNGDIYVCGKNSSRQIPIYDTTIFKINERGDLYLDKFTKLNSDIKNIHFNTKSSITIRSGISTNKILDITTSENFKFFLISKYKINTLQQKCIDKLKHFDFYDLIKSYLLPSDKLTIHSSEEIDFN
jgi:alpha-tubulin suppressor-like RCC1 family protein